MINVPLDLDRVRAILAHDETASQLIVRLVQERIATGVFFVDKHSLVGRAGTVLEVSGPAASGKSEVLVQTAGSCLVKNFLLDDPGAATGHVIFLDLDGKFDPLRLLKVLNIQYGRLGLTHAGADCYQSFQHNCLSRFTLVRCDSSFDLLTTLAGLPTLIASAQAGGGRVVLLIDNIGAFYWQDRACRAALLRSGSGGPRPQVEPPLTLHRVTTAITSRLQTLSQQFRLSIVVTKNANNSYQAPVTNHQDGGGTSGAAAPHHLTSREYLPSAWQALVTHRILLARTPAGNQTFGEDVRVAQWQGVGSHSEAPAAFWISDGGIVPGRGNVEVAYMS